MRADWRESKQCLVVDVREEEVGRWLFTVGKAAALGLDGDLSWVWEEVGGYLRVRVQIDM